MTKPTPQQVWRQLLDEAGEDEIASVLALTPEQVQAELAGHGADVAAERARADQFLQDLASGALDAGAKPAAPAAGAPGSLLALERQPPTSLAARRRRPRTALVLLAAATTAAAAGGLAYSALHHAPTPPQQPTPQPPPPPSVTESPVVPDLVAAATWRQKAVAACDASRWDDCLADLDRARALDPAGDDTPVVKSTRDRALKGMSGKQ